MSIAWITSCIKIYILKEITWLPQIYVAKFSKVLITYQNFARGARSLNSQSNHLLYFPTTTWMQRNMNQYWMTIQLNHLLYYPTINMTQYWMAIWIWFVCIEYGLKLSFYLVFLVKQLLRVQELYHQFMTFDGMCGLIKLTGEINKTLEISKVLSDIIKILKTGSWNYPEILFTAALLSLQSR